MNHATLQPRDPMPKPRISPAWLCPAHLSEDVTCQGLIKAGMAVNECKEVQARAVLLHHKLKEPLVFKHVQHLEKDKVRSGPAEMPSAQHI